MNCGSVKRYPEGAVWIIHVLWSKTIVTSAVTSCFLPRQRRRVSVYLHALFCQTKGLECDRFMCSFSVLYVLFWMVLSIFVSNMWRFIQDFFILSLIWFSIIFLFVTIWKGLINYFEHCNVYFKLFYYNVIGCTDG